MIAKEMIASPSASPLSGIDLEKLVIGGDLSVLHPAAKAQHYIAVCNSMGLNPSTKPFAYIKLNGKEVLYALRDCTDQLRSLKQVAITITAREITGEVFQVTARAQLPNGRTDESIGAVPVQGLRGEALANAYMKAETKAKRRVTLSICGLGFLDESEVGSVAGSGFDQLPQETKPRPQMIEAPKPAGIPPPPDVVDRVPPGFALGKFKPLAVLEGVPFETMAIEDLELVVSMMRDNRQGIKNDNARAWALAMEAAATDALRDAQMDTDMPPEAPRE